MILGMRQSLASSPVVQALFAAASNDYSTLSTTSSMPDGGLITRAGNAMLYDSTGKLTWAPNNQYINSGSATNTARTITTVAGVNYYIWIQTSTETATIVASGTNTTTFNGSTSGTFTAFTATAGTLTLTPTSNFANITQVVVAQITYETALRSGDNYVTGASAYYGPRFDYDPVTLQNKGLLVEGARTNLASQSSVSTASPWATYINGSGSITVTVPGNITSPDGTSNAAKIVVNRSASTDYAEQYQTFTGTAASYTFSIWLKADSGADVGKLVSVAMLNGTTIVGATLVTLTANWTRYTTTATLAASAACQINIGYLPNANGGGTQTGSVSFNAFGAQVELGSFASSYIPTVASSVARAAETFTLAGYTNKLVESFYIDEQTGGSWSGNTNASATSPLTISTPTFGWVTSLRPYTNAYAGDISTPSWIDNNSTVGGRMYYDSTGALTWAPANLLTNSQSFSGGIWAASNFTITTSQSDPIGNNNATLATFTSNGGDGLYSTSISFASDKSYIISVYLKYGTWQWFEFTTVSGSATRSWVDLQNGVAGTNNHTNFAVTPVGGGWYRVSAKISGATQIYLSPRNNNGNSAAATTNNGTTFYVFGFQVEPVTYQTSPRAYIPTTSAAVYQPRYDYDPSVTPATPRGMLIEEQRNNICLYSQALNNLWTNAYAAFGSGSIVNASVAPDGTTTACQLTETLAASTQFVVSQAVTASASISYTLSCYVKRAVGSRNFYIQVNLAGGTTGAGFVWFNLDTGVASSATTLTGTFVSGTPTMTNAGNGWYRCVLPITTNAGTTSFTQFIGSYNSARVYNGDGASALLIWGASVEHAGTIASPTSATFATSYIPTTTASVTRVADVVKLSGSALTTAQSAQSSVIAEAQVITTSKACAVYAASDGTINNFYNYFTNAGSSTLQIYSGGASQGVLSPSGTILANTTFRIAEAVKALSFASVVNGGTVVANNTAAIPIGINTFYLGANYAAGNYLNGYARSLALYNQRLPDPILKQKSTVNAPY